MKPIKFDLRMNDAKVSSLEALQENFTAEILPIFQSGRLSKWLKSRDLLEQASAIEAIEKNASELQQLKAICQVLELDDDEEVLQFLLEDRQPPEAAPAASISPEADVIVMEVEETVSISISITDVDWNGDEVALAALAASSDVPLSEDVQEKLASIGTPTVRKALASNPNLGEHQQKYLATTGSEEVKCTLAKNPSLLKAVQALLVTDESNIREALACNPALDAGYMDKLMNDSSRSVKASLAGNPAMTKDRQLRLADSNTGSNATLKSLAKNTSLSEELMKRFVTSDNDVVKVGLASNTALPESIQAQLIKCSEEVRTNLANNPALKIAQQAELAGDRGIDVRLALYDNPSLDISIKKRVISSINQYDLSAAKSDLEYANSVLADKVKEHKRLSEKLNKKITGWSFSDSGIESLSGDVDYAYKERDEARKETRLLEKRLRGIKNVLAQQTS